MRCSWFAKGVRFAGGWRGAVRVVKRVTRATLVIALAPMALAEAHLTRVGPAVSARWATWLHASSTVHPPPVPNVRQLTSNTSDTGQIENARISDDGSVVVYDNGANVFIAATDGHGRHALTTQGGCRQPYPSADGGQVVMRCYVEIVLLNGSTRTAITNSQRLIYNSNPSISADGQTIVFGSNANYGGGNSDGSQEVFRWHAGQIQAITHTARGSYRPLISGDGHRILFERGGSVYLFDDQTGETLLTRSISGSAQLTRDGQSAVFRARTIMLSNGGQPMDLYKQPVGAAVQQLTQTFKRADSVSGFAANADGSRIAAVFPNRSMGEGLLFTPAGPRALPGVPADASSLSFDAAGRHLAFVSRENLTDQNPNRRSQLFVADIPLDPGPPVPSATPTPHPTAGAPCPGDCSDDQSVTVDEILTMVNIALGNTDLATCTAGDVNGDGSIAVDEILTAVNDVLNGCQRVGTPMQQGLVALSAADVHSASGLFCRAATEAPAGDASNLYCAFSRVLTTMLDDPQLQSLARRSGVAVVGDSRDVCSWWAVVPHDPPSDAPHVAEIVAALRDVLLPQIDSAVSTLDNLPDNVEALFSLGNLPYCMRVGAPGRGVRIGHGDVLAATAGLKIARAWLDMLVAYNLDVDPGTLIRETPQRILAGSPTLLTLTSAASLEAARQDLSDALARASMAITSVLDETGDQSSDLLVIAPQDRSGAQTTVRVLDLIRQSLQGQIVLSSDVGLQQPFRLDLSKLFSGQFSDLQPLLPGFTSDGKLDFAHFPDPTLGGVAPDLTQLEINRAFLGNHCWYEVRAATQGDCDAVAARLHCRSDDFSLRWGLGLCWLSGCICGWSGR